MCRHHHLTLAESTVVTSGKSVLQRAVINHEVAAMRGKGAFYAVEPNRIK